MIISTCCSGDKNLEILFRACHFRFAFLHTASLRCSVKTSIKGFTLILIVMFLHLKLGKALGVLRVIIQYKEVVEKSFVKN